MKVESTLNTASAVESSSEVALRDQIETRAYHIWLKEGGRHGEDLPHWLQAESEILKALSQDQAERAAARKSRATPKLRSSPAPDESIFKP